MSKHINKIIFGIALFLFAYTAYRALVLSITWDEAFSYLQFTRHEIFIPEKYEQMHANNHFLNTWMSIYFIKWFGVSEFVLRLPALIAHLLFLFFSYKLIRNFENKWLVLVAFLIINLNPYILDFFSLSRGYALSLGLMMTSIYYLYTYFANEYKAKYAIYSSLTGALATLANFVILNYFIVSFGIILLVAGYIFLKYKGKLANQSLVAIAGTTVIVSLSLWFLVPVAMKLKEGGALFYGGKSGFWSDTICTITDRCFYGLPYPHIFQQAAKGFLFFIIAAVIVIVGYKIIKKKTSSSLLFLGALLFLILFCALSTLVQHHFLGTLLLIDRTAMFFVVLFNLLLVFFINELSKQNSKAIILSLLINGLIVVHFVWAFNLNYVLEWKSNADIKEMLVDLKKVVEIPKEKTNIDICIPLSFDQPINYYRAVDNLNWINTVERNSTANFLFDYLYLEPSEFTSINTDSMIVFNTYPITGNIFGKPKESPNLTKVCFLQEHDFTKTKEGVYIIDEKIEYAQGFNYIINDSITPSRTAQVAFKATVSSSDASTCDLIIVLSLENKDGAYLWKRAYIKDYVKKSNEWTDISYTSLVPDDAKAGDELKAYIWNQNKHSLSVKKMELKWLGKP